MKTQEQDLAELLHRKLCFSNHIDDCDWNYGNWQDTSNYARQQYLALSNKILSKVSYHTAKKVISCLD